MANVEPANEMAVPSEHSRRKKVATRLARVEGQVRGIKALVENGTDCEQIAIQMSAARRALDRAFYEMLSCSLLTRVDDAAGVDEIRASTDELARLLTKYA
jgi:DNA-binding FrmR family transcriptional regulator